MSNLVCHVSDDLDHVVFVKGDMEIAWTPRYGFGHLQTSHNLALLCEGLTECRDFDRFECVDWLAALAITEMYEHKLRIKAEAERQKP